MQYGIDTKWCFGALSGLGSYLLYRAYSSLVYDSRRANVGCLPSVIAENSILSNSQSSDSSMILAARVTLRRWQTCPPSPCSFQRRSLLCSHSSRAYSTSAVHPIRFSKSFMSLGCSSMHAYSSLLSQISLSPCGPPASHSSSIPSKPTSIPS